MTLSWPYQKSTEFILINVFYSLKLLRMAYIKKLKQNPTNQSIDGPIIGLVFWYHVQN